MVAPCNFTMPNNLTGLFGSSGSGIYEDVNFLVAAGGDNPSGYMQYGGSRSGRARQSALLSQRRYRGNPPSEQQRLINRNKASRRRDQRSGSQLRHAIHLENDRETLTYGLNEHI